MKNYDLGLKHLGYKRDEDYYVEILMNVGEDVMKVYWNINEPKISEDVMDKAIIEGTKEHNIEVSLDRWSNIKLFLLQETDWTQIADEEIEPELKAKYDDLRKHLRSVHFENPLDYHTESDIWEPVTDTLYDPERNISLKRS
jgi:hypothetical protein